MPTQRPARIADGDATERAQHPRDSRDARAKPKAETPRCVGNIPRPSSYALLRCVLCAPSVAVYRSEACTPAGEIYDMRYLEIRLSKVCVGSMYVPVRSVPRR